ncbi:hypothetical protein MKK69_06205 [Methylobacterium sp. J-026]|nr:hypothetical protein [Methylobacterium sp. J-026]
MIARAEDAANRLGQSEACDGHRLMATQGLVAIRHLHRIIETHRNRLAFEALPNAVSQPVPPRRTWLSVMRRHLSSGSRALETQA